MASDFCFTPATVLRDQIRNRQLSPVELLDAVLARCEAVEPKMHAFVAIDERNALAAAKAAEEAVMRGDDLGPLHGIPVSIKDLFATAGMRTTYGSKFY